jgi:hypothetical protein
MAYRWQNIRILEACADYENGVCYDFSYKNGVLDTVKLSHIGGKLAANALDRLGVRQLWGVGR